MQFGAIIFWTILLQLTLKSNQNQIMVPVVDEFLQKLTQFIVDREMIILFQRYDCRIIFIDESEKAAAMLNMIVQRIIAPTVVVGQSPILLNMHAVFSTSITFIFIEDENELKGVIEHLRIYKLQQPSNPTVLVKLSQIKHEEAFDILSIMKTAWSLGLTRFLLIYSDVNMKAFSYNPFTKSIHDLSNKTGNQLFPKYMKNMHKYLLRVSMFEEWPLLRKRPGVFRSSLRWIGRDFFLLTEVARRLNATVRIIEPPPKTSYQGAIIDVKEGKVDFCFVRRFPRYGFTEFRYVQTGSLSGLSIIVSKPPYREKPTSIILVFRQEIWFLLILTMILLINLLRFFMLTESETYGITNIFLDLWKVLLNIPLQDGIRQKFNSIIPLVVWIWASLILGVSFQCRFIYLMRYPRLEDGIRTLRDVEKSQMPVYTSIDYVRMQGNGGYLRNQMKLVTYNEVLEKLRTSNSGVAIAVPFLVVRGKTSSDFLEFLDRRNMMIVHEKLIRSLAGYTFPYYSPFTSTIYMAILEFIEFGFMDKVPKSLRHGNKITTPTKSTFSLNIKHVMTAFQVLSIGLSLGIISLILERFANSDIHKKC